SIVLTSNGVLLAFAEARKEENDHAENKIVMKLSLDGGKTWSGMQVIASAARDSLNNPLAVNDSEKGRILLMYQYYPLTRPEELETPELWKSHADQLYPPNIHEAAAQEGYEGDRICRTLLISSVDDGDSWTPPLDITRSVKRPRKVTSYAGGPGIGIQIKHADHRGRIIMPFSQGPWSDMKVYAVYSDDHGLSWKQGRTAPGRLKGQPNEVQMLELSDGRIMLNARTFRGKPYRMTAISSKGGENWSELKYDEALPDPGCQGSILGCSFPGNREQNMILFSNPSHQKKRIKGTIRLSLDNGKTWKWSKQVEPGAFGYSCLTQLKDGSIGLLYEAGESKLFYQNLTLEYLTDGIIK
ncbi:MAG: exo-alpha-sialidase, partial [Bacteroidales bacterium]|nr:exo-alpha-sialidase [Bacteroidales bacterium]